MSFHSTASARNRHYSRRDDSSSDHESHQAVDQVVCAAIDFREVQGVRRGLLTSSGRCAGGGGWRTGRT